MSESKLPIYSAMWVRERLDGWGFPYAAQERLGAFMITWTMFEAELERSLWSLGQTHVAGTRPWTDTSSIGDWIKVLGEPWPHLPPEAHSVLKTVSQAAEELASYRHALAHGWIALAPTPFFHRNPSWNRELRKRPSTFAYATPKMLDSALECVWSLLRILGAIHQDGADNSQFLDLISLKSVAEASLSMALDLSRLPPFLGNA